jgi:uncharacterized membrane protein
MHPINSVKGAITAGVVVAIVIGILLVCWAGTPVTFHPVRADRWLHILSGVMWIGLLYYFNVVQTPGLAAAAADKGGPGGAGVTKYIAPRALVWFRWAAVLTWLTGAGYLMSGYGSGNASAIVSAFTLQSGYRTIGVGAWLGTIMLFNVWVLIWPNQKKILGIVPADDAQKAKARKIAAMASRTNTMLSIPMLMCMASAFHGLPLIHG